MSKAQNEFDVEELLAPPEQVPDPTRPDPVRHAAHLMVDRALDGHPDTLKTAIVQGAVVILVLAAEWSSVIARAWRSRVFGQPDDEPCDDDYRRRIAREESAKAWPLAIVENEVASKKRGTDEPVSLALRRGKGILITAADLEFVSPSLRACADLVIDVPGPSPEMLLSVSEALCTGPGILIGGRLAEAVMPENLLACLRPDQSAADYLGRLSRVVAAGMPTSVVSKARWTLDNLPLPPDVEVWGRQLVVDIADYRAGTIKWADVDKGALLFGPPGGGKTTFAGALAASCGVPLVVGGYAIWDSGEDGKSDYSKLIKNMRATFRDAKAKAPCILFIDEIDSFVARGSAGHNESWFRPLMNGLLSELSGVNDREGVVVIAATNLPDEIDPALRRAGRLDRELHMSAPDAKMLARILAVHLPGLPPSDLAVIAAEMPGASGADVEKVARGARRTARLARRAVTMADVTLEVRPELPPVPRALRHRVAVHEAGHALCTVVQEPGSLIRVSIRAGSAGRTSEGGTAAMGSEVVGVMLARILAGRAAEELVFGRSGMGCGGPEHSDLAQATLAAAKVECAYGQGGRLSWLGNPTAETLPQLLALHRGVGDRVERRLTEALEVAREMLSANRVAFEALVDALIERESLSGQESEEIVRTAGKKTGGGVHQASQLDADKTEPDSKYIALVASGRRNDVIRFQAEQSAEEAHGLYKFLEAIYRVVPVASSVSELMSEIGSRLTPKKRATAHAQVVINPKVLNEARLLMDRHIAAFSSAA
jgi:hypothetical protein